MPSARYFTLTHLYNAGESSETLRAYQIALSKLVNSLSWGSEIIQPQPIDERKTIFYIDLRNYEWDVRNDAWTQIEQEYPYSIEFRSRNASRFTSEVDRPTPRDGVRSAVRACRLVSRNCLTATTLP